MTLVKEFLSGKNIFLAESYCQNFISGFLKSGV